jgi:hypothetical protein
MTSETSWGSDVIFWHCVASTAFSPVCCVLLLPRQVEPLPHWAGREGSVTSIPTPPWSPSSQYSDLLQGMFLHLPFDLTRSICWFLVIISTSFPGEQVIWVLILSSWKSFFQFFMMGEIWENLSVHVKNAHGRRVGWIYRQRWVLLGECGVRAQLCGFIVDM